MGRARTRAGPRRKPRPTRRAKAPSQPDLLLDILKLARTEGSLEGTALTAFAEALRERARLILAERVQRLEDRALEKENDWRREAMPRLEEAVRSLQSEAEALRGEHRKAAHAHDALLAHHREMTRRIAAELVAIAALPPLRMRQARARLTALAELLRSETG